MRCARGPGPDPSRPGENRVMEFAERISGVKAVEIFRRLEENRTPVRILVLGLDYDRLTIVTGIERREGRTFILVDYPWGFKDQVPESEGRGVRLEFTDKDRIPHSCRTEISDVGERDLWLDFPPFVERIQRRKHFRVEPPHGTRLLWSFGRSDHEAHVVNISLGGTLVISPILSGHQAYELQAGNSLSGLRLVGEKGAGQVEIAIDKALVKRAEKSPDTDRMTFALQFVEMDRAEKQVLEEFIFYCQRRLLRKRSGLTPGIPGDPQA